MLGVQYLFNYICDKNNCEK